MLIFYIGSVGPGSTNGTVEMSPNEQKQQLAPTVIIILIACLCGTILILLIIIGICLIRGPPGLGIHKPKEPNHNLQEGRGNKSYT